MHSSYHKSQKEALAALTRLRNDRLNGLKFDPSHQTLAEFLLSWLEDSVKGAVTFNTHRRYSGIVKGHIIPAIGSIRLKKLGPQHLNQLYREKQKSGQMHTARFIHSIIHRALVLAVRWELVYRNIADIVDVPRVQKKEMKVLDQVEVARFLKAAEDDMYYALYVVAVTCGLRQGEILGLKWADLDLDKETMEIQRQLQWKTDGYHFPPPKSKKARRSVALPSVTVKALRSHRASQNEMRLSLKNVWEDLDLVFTTIIGSPIRPSNLLRRSFYSILAKAGLPRIRFHDLRHTAATLLLQPGVHAKIV